MSNERAVTDKDILAAFRVELQEVRDQLEKKRERRKRLLILSCAVPSSVSLFGTESDSLTPDIKQLEDYQRKLEEVRQYLPKPCPGCGGRGRNEQNGEICTI